jgi:type I restriction enzyme S subunit
VLTLSAITGDNFDALARKDAWFARPLAAHDQVSASDFLICPGNGNPALVGRGQFPIGEMPGTAFPDTMIAARPNTSRLDPMFLAALWSSGHVRAQIAVAARTTNGTYKINQQAVVGTVLPLPPLDEQRRIVDLLERAAGIRRLREQALAKTRAIVPALFHDMFGDPAANPMGWPVMPLEALLEMPPRNGVSPAKSGTITASVLTLAAITGEHFQPEARKEGSFARPLGHRVFVSERDMLICRGNGNVNLVGRAQAPLVDMSAVVFPDTIIAVHPSPSKMNLPYLAAVWSSNAVRARLRAAARTTNGTFKINQEIIAAVPIPLPPIRLQNAFADRLADLRSIIAQQERSLAASRELERSLMARLLG